MPGFPAIHEVGDQLRHDNAPNEQENTANRPADGIQGRHLRLGAASDSGRFTMLVPKTVYGLFQVGQFLGFQVRQIVFIVLDAFFQRRDCSVVTAFFSLLSLQLLPLPLVAALPRNRRRRTDKQQKHHPSGDRLESVHSHPHWR